MQRLDIRAQFTEDPVSDELLNKLLRAAHHAPSVGWLPRLGLDDLIFYEQWGETAV
jgi:nitroreductase